MISKKELRKEVLKRRDALTLEERREKSEEIAKQVILQKAFQEADTILLFASYKSEVDTTEIFHAAINAEKEVYYPKVLGSEMEFYQVRQDSDLIEGYRGIREPEINELQRFVPEGEEKICVIMPGAVFDVDGNRIGYGGGYYDKYLQQLEANTFKESVMKVAVAFGCQIVAQGIIQSQEYDIKPNLIVTENCAYKIGNSCKH